MVVSFGYRATEDVYHNRPMSPVRRFPHDSTGLALVKLDVLNGASAVFGLTSPPGNRLEALKGDLKGFHSIRANDQWQVVLRWENNNAHNVRLMYHYR
ncbi:MAG: type II toxin-antitoxin system RelE/ParE family toxin [Coriobacteriia bacterium]|nr:type II toxin-antitoxin system RelE/ParE family toxin [Coriobacteriia bacterium]